MKILCAVMEVMRVLGTLALAFTLVRGTRPV